MNITPLVDVMLVLLVIFILAAPIPTRRLVVASALPCAVDCSVPAEPVRLALKSTGEMYWNGAAVNRVVLARQLAALAANAHAPVLEIHIEPSARYALLTGVLAAARNAGVRRIDVAPR